LYLRSQTHLEATLDRRILNPFAASAINGHDGSADS